jgi:hypothetical protein
MLSKRRAMIKCVEAYINEELDFAHVRQEAEEVLTHPEKLMLNEIIELIPKGYTAEVIYLLCVKLISLKKQAVRARKHMINNNYEGLLREINFLTKGQAIEEEKDV